MANSANNEAIIVFKEPIRYIDAELVIKDFNNNVVEITSSYIGQSDTELVNCIELSFESRWTEPREALEKLAIDYNCSIYGVCWEWGCLYVNHYEINTPI